MSNQRLAWHMHKKSQQNRLGYLENQLYQLYYPLLNMRD